MEHYKADFTNTFVALTVESYQSLDGSGLFKSKEFNEWETKWKARIERQEGSLELSYETMKNHNPTLIPRNHQVEQALELASTQGDYTDFNNLLKALSAPYDYNHINQAYMTPLEPSGTPYRTFCGT